MKTYLFAYGSLLTGALEPQVRLLLRRHCRPAEPARVRGRLLDLGDYPGALPDGETWIHGQLIELLAPERCWPVLDTYEGYLPQDPGRSLYLRERVTARRAPDDTGVGCWIYWLREPPSRPRLIAGGDWPVHLAGRRS